jgi:hypothetical protein
VHFDSYGSIDVLEVTAAIAASAPPWGELEVPITGVFALDDVRDAF